MTCILKEKLPVMGERTLRYPRVRDLPSQDLSSSKIYLSFVCLIPLVDLNIFRDWCSKSL